MSTRKDREDTVSIFNSNRLLPAASAIALFVLVAISTEARASSRFWLRDDTSNGVRFGTGRLHTSLEFETRYDSFAGWERTGPEMEQVGDVVLHVKPRVELQVPSRTLRLEADAGLDYVGYTGAESGWTRRQSKLNANLGLNGVLNPDGDVSIELDERFVRSDRTTNLELGVLTISNRNDIFLGFDVRPGSGALSIRPKFINTLEFFEPRDEQDGLGIPSNVDRWNYMENTVGVDLGYRMTERTAVVFDTTVGFRNYEQEASQAFDTTNLRITAGFVGMVAPKVEVKANLGYGAQLVSDDALSDDAFGGVIGNAEIGYLASNRTTVHLGYRRDFRSSPTSYLHYSNDRGYLTGQWRLSREFGARMTLAYDSLRFSNDRVDEIFSIAIGPEYQPSDRIAVGATYGFLDRVSTTDAPSYVYDRNEFGAYVAVRY